MRHASCNWIVAVSCAAVLLAGCAAAPKGGPVVNLTEGIKVSASAWENVADGGWKDFPPTKTIDGDLSKLSSWRAEAEGEDHGQWIQYDLGKVRTVSRLRVAFLQGDVRIYRFDIKLSPDGHAWTKAFSETSGGKTADFETFELGDRPARYVRLTGYGNRATEGENKFPKWFNIVETEIHGR